MKSTDISRVLGVIFSVLTFGCSPNYDFKWVRPHIESRVKDEKTPLRLTTQEFRDQRAGLGNRIVEIPGAVEFASKKQISPGITLSNDVLCVFGRQHAYQTRLVKMGQHVIVRGWVEPDCTEYIDASIVFVNGKEL